MNKLVIIINGHGQAGKDTVCEITEKYYGTMNISTITPIKELAKLVGWDGSKEDKDRKFLSDMKKLLIDYNDTPLNYVVEKYNEFIASDYDQVLYIHCREPEEIDKIKNKIGNDEIKVVTLLIKRDSIKDKFGNSSDDNVENYEYDFTFENNGELDKLEHDYIDFFEDTLVKNTLSCGKL